MWGRMLVLKSVRQYFPSKGNITMKEDERAVDTHWAERTGH